MQRPVTLTAMLFLVVLASVPLFADCDFYYTGSSVINISDPSGVWDGTFTAMYYQIVCDGAGVTEQNQNGQTATVGSPSDIPSVSILYVSDADPLNLTVTAWFANSLYATVFVNGASHNPVWFGTQQSSSQTLLVQSVGAFQADVSNNTVDVQGCTDQALCATGTFYVDRASSQRNYDGLLKLQWFPPCGPNLVCVSNVYYERQVQGNLITTTYDVATNGYRNGRIEHMGAVETLGWDSIYDSPVRSQDTYVAGNSFAVSYDTGGCSAPWPSTHTLEYPSCFTYAEFVPENSPTAQATLLIDAHTNDGQEPHVVYGLIDNIYPTVTITP